MFYFILGEHKQIYELVVRDVHLGPNLQGCRGPLHPKTIDIP